MANALAGCLYLLKAFDATFFFTTSHPKMFRDHDGKLRYACQKYVIYHTCVLYGPEVRSLDSLVTDCCSFYFFLCMVHKRIATTAGKCLFPLSCHLFYRHLYLRTYFLAEDLEWTMLTAAIFPVEVIVDGSSAGGLGEDEVGNVIIIKSLS